MPPRGERHPLDAAGHAAVLAVREEYGGKVRRIVGKRWPGLARAAGFLLGPDGFEAACMRGLVVAASKYDTARGVKLLTYAVPWMRNEVQADLRQVRGLDWKGNGLPMAGDVPELENGRLLCEMFGECPSTAEADAERAEVVAAVRRAVAALPARWRAVVLKRADGVTLREIAREMRISRERVRQLYEKAANQLREQLQGI